MMDRRKTVFVVDDEKNMLSTIRRSLRKIDADILYFDCPKELLQYSENHQPDLVISDQRMPIIQGTKLLDKIKSHYPQVNNILLSAYHDFDDVALAFNQKIIQKYLSKPWGSNELFLLVDSMLGRTSELVVSDENSDEFPRFHGMISTDEAMACTFEHIKKASNANIPIFVTGATGTGKELVAKACHAESNRRDKVFIAVNCANFSENLMESQLFGHTKGAFTGAVINQQGLFSATESGTLFLDEITCLPLPLQAKLLRVIQEKRFCPVGSNKEKIFEGRIITASSTPLHEAVQSGDFREDLFYRLNVISIGLPSLIDRGKDVLLLADYFLQKFCNSTGAVFSGFSDRAKILLSTYTWPGNIRQLENLIHSVVILNHGTEVTEHMLKQGLPGTDIAGKGACTTIKSTTMNYPKVQPLWLSEKETIENTIDFFHGNIPKAAAALEVSPSTLYRKVQSWKTQTNIACVNG
ncbi:MAG: sigma-54 dependent transcriptional regulator [Pseudomonadales bacterium]